jgi:hypothetical protein
MYMKNLHLEVFFTKNNKKDWILLKKSFRYLKK